MIRAAFRVLPLSIVVMVVLGVVKLSGLVQAAAPSLLSAGRSVVPSAVAAETKSSGPAAPAPPAAAMPPAAVPAAVPVPPPGPSETERALLQDLRARREALDVRDKALQSRDVLQKAAERGLQDRLNQLTTLQARLEELEKGRRERDEANWRGLVKTYETMRPRDAAAIFNELEQAVLVQVLDRMKEAKAAPVLAAMLPDRARAATAQLVQWRARSAAEPQG